MGNKCDMEDERVISFERGKQLADSLGLEFYETSAKENINVRVSIDPRLLRALREGCAKTQNFECIHLQAVFERLVDIICDKMSESLDNDPGLLNSNKGTRLGEGAQPSQMNCNC